MRVLFCTLCSIIVTSAGCQASIGTERGAGDGGHSASPRDAGASDGGAGRDGTTGLGDAGPGRLDAGATGPDGCELGTTETAWATQCADQPPVCTPGSFRAGGPDPSNAGFRLVRESAHFALYSDENVAADLAQRALDVLENTVWSSFFSPPISLPEPYCAQASKLKASVHVHSDWGLTGGAWTDPDGLQHMGMWIGTGALEDHWGLAHEFTHAVQSEAGGMRCDQSNTCGWVYESHANFMPHQLAEYDAELHCSEMLVNVPHLYLGSTRDRYCNWQFMEYLKDRYCYRAVNAIWTGEPAPDPFTAIMRAQGWSVTQLNDFIGEWALHNVTWDYRESGAAMRAAYGPITDTSRVERRLRLTQLEPLGDDWTQSRRFVSPSAWAPQRFGYNVVPLVTEEGVDRVTVTFRGVEQPDADADFRWGLVEADRDLQNPRYSRVIAGRDGSLSFCVQPGAPLFLVVAATPATQEQIVWDQPYNTVRRYPYMVALDGAWPRGLEGGRMSPCTEGLTRHENGGGCAPSDLPDSVFVAPFARVLAGANVTGTARIEEHATVVRGTVSGGVVAGLTLLGTDDRPFTLGGDAQARTTFYPLGFFEPQQALSGSAALVGDVEYRGQGVSRSTGTHYGFVDPNTPPAADTTDLTSAPPYAWRP